VLPPTVAMDLAREARAVDLWMTKAPYYTAIPDQGVSEIPHTVDSSAIFWKNALLLG
jgi:hypothetical protein